MLVSTQCILRKRLDAEVDHCAAHLNCLVVPRQKRRALLDQHQSAKLTLIILKHELAVFKLDFGVASTN